MATLPRLARASRDGGLSRRLPTKQEDYGIDAPGVVRSLMSVGVLLSVAGGVALVVRSGSGEDVSPILRILPRFIPSGIICLIMGFWMIVSSKWLLAQRRDKMPT